MFCPNCGKNCGDARFCSACGTQLKGNDAQEQQQKPWVEGTPCPYCGGMQIENGKCMYCGVQLQQVIADSYEFPYDFYGSILSDSIELQIDACVITKRSLFKKHITKIPYDQITEAIYAKDGAWGGTPHHIAIRWEGNKSLPMPAVGKMAFDKTSFTTYDMTYKFFHVFCALKTKASVAAKFSISPLPAMEKLRKKVPEELLTKLYDTHAPFRERAVKDLQKAVGVAEQEAQAIIDYDFEMRQWEMYNQQPKFAIRDLNRIRQEQEREYQEYQRKREERRNRR